uniref:1,4-alpha-glucan branching enzyme n=1 Tax=Tetraselmis sp. GSL018 TaxID=582737 RepID=A0A061R8G3_9CHLO
MSSEDPRVASYLEFKDNVLPRVKALGYTAVQLMAIQEHAYYASFGYHVTSPFAVSSRSGTPDELKALVDEAHGMGLQVYLDVVHSHISSNAEDGIAGFDFGQGEDCNYFCEGEAGYHRAWDSRCLAYRNWEVLRYLLSNCRFWIEEYRFDGFRFDGVTSMLYHHHGIGFSFSGNYHEYFSPATNVDAIVYLMLANELIHSVLPSAVTIAEDVSGMPSLCRPVSEGGIGFDFRLSMGIPDTWTRYLKDVRDEDWSMRHLVAVLCNRRPREAVVAYCESHDQALVGDKTIAFRLMDAEMYDHMSALQERTPVVARGVALHKMIRLLTLALGGTAWLNFMGNEFGHPEWIDFPREGNSWSHEHCRRQWRLVDRPDLLYSKLNDWDAAMHALDERFRFVTDPHLFVSEQDDERKVIVCERGELVFVFNFNVSQSYEGYKVGVGLPGKYRVVLDSDDIIFGGSGRVGHDTDHFTSPEGTPGTPETNFNNRPHSMLVLSPARSVVVYARYFDQ